MTAPAPTDQTDPVTGAGNDDPQTGGDDKQNDTPLAPPQDTAPPKNDPAPTFPPASSGSGDKKDDQPSTSSGKKDEVDWKARARQWEDTAKKNKTAMEERDQLKLTMQAIAAALDPNGSKDLDPEEVTKRAIAERDAKDQELKQLRIEQAAERAGRRAGADVDALLDSRGFVTAIGKLDPTADDFSDRVTEAVEAALKTNPRLKAQSGTTAPTRTATDPGGKRDTSGTGQLTRADLAGMTPEQIVEARKNGRLNSLLKGTTA